MGCTGCTCPGCYFCRGIKETSPSLIRVRIHFKHSFGHSGWSVEYLFSNGGTHTESLVDYLPIDLGISQLREVIRSLAKAKGGDYGRVVIEISDDAGSEATWYNH